MRQVLVLIVVLLSLAAIPALAQQTDTTKPAADTMKAQPQAEQAAEQMDQSSGGSTDPFYGGYVGAQFGDYSSVTVSPLIGWHITPILLGGLRFQYEYAWVDEWNASNYGGAVFAIARVHPKVFLQGEFQYLSYEWPTIGGGSNREWVPFLYLGGGFSQPLGGNMSLVASVMVDVLQDENSPYEDWAPTFTVGVVAGF